MTRKPTFWGVLFAVTIILISLVVFADMSRMSVASVYDSAGPRFFPLTFATGLLACGAVAFRDALRQRGEEMEPMDWMPLVLISAGLIIQSTLLETLGWIITATTQFVLTAQAFGRFSIVKSVLFGLAMAMLTYVGFVYGLQLDMPLFPLGYTPGF